MSDDADYLGIAERLRYSCIPEHAKLGAWIIAKHKQWPGADLLGTLQPEHCLRAVMVKADRPSDLVKRR